MYSITSQICRHFASIMDIVCLLHASILYILNCLQFSIYIRKRRKSLAVSARQQFRMNCITVMIIEGSSFGLDVVLSV